MDDVERAAIHKAADDINVNLSEFCRSVLLRAIGIDRLAKLEIASEEKKNGGNKKRKNKRRRIVDSNEDVNIDTIVKWSTGS